MLECVLNSMLHLVWSVCLLLVVLLIFALLLVQGVTHRVIAAHVTSPEDFEHVSRTIGGNFSSLPTAMLSLFRATTGGQDWGELYRILSQAGAIYEMIFLFYIAFFTIVAWNTVLSTFVEKAMRLSAPDVETLMLEQRKTEQAYSQELFKILSGLIDDNHDGFVTLAEFKQHLKNPTLSGWFAARNFDLKDAEIFFNLLSDIEHDNKVKLSTFVQGVMRLRGNASNIDLQTLHYDIKSMYYKQGQAFSKISRVLSDFCERQQRVDASLSTLSLGTMRDDCHRAGIDDNKPTTKLSEWRRERSLAL